MADKRVPSQESFAEFKTRYDKNNEEIQSLLHRILTKIDSKVTYQPTKSEKHAELSTLSRFEGVIPHPKSGRSSKQSSFVNVALSLQHGIKAYNDTQLEDHDRIQSKEFEGSLLSWTHAVMSAVRSIIGGVNDLNLALGVCSMDEIRRSGKYDGRPAKFNRDVSAVIREIRKVLPVVVLSKGDWASRELLKNTFQNSKKKQCKKEKRLNCLEKSSADKSDVFTVNDDTAKSRDNNETLPDAIEMTLTTKKLQQSDQFGKRSTSPSSTKRKSVDCPDDDITPDYCGRDYQSIRSKTTGEKDNSSFRLPKERH